MKEKEINASLPIDQICQPVYNISLGVDYTSNLQTIMGG